MDAAEKNRLACRAYYRKNRKELLEKLRVKRLSEDGERMRELARANYEKHSERRAADQSAYRAANREKTNAESRASYHRNKGKHGERRRAYYDANYDKIYAGVRAWEKQNPDRALVHHAKRLLSEETGINFRDIPDELAEAKVAQIKVHRVVRDGAAK